MFTRVLLNITKHKVLNILLVFLFILSFAGMTFSSVFVYKTSSFLNTIKDSDDFIVISSEDYGDEQTINYSIDKLDFDVYVEIYDGLKSNDKDVEVIVDVYPINVEIEEFAIDPNSTDEAAYENQVMPVYDYDQVKYSYTLPEEHDRTKIYVTEKVLEEHNLTVGDEVTLSSMNNFSISEEGQGIEYEEIEKLEIGGILEINEDIEDDAGMGQENYVYIPGEIIFESNDPSMYIYMATLVVKGDDAVVADVYETVKNSSNDTNIYYSKDVETDDLEFFVKIRDFFAIIFASTIAVFAFAILSLNNNIMDRRSDELRLYNVFGLGSRPILVQLIIEKLSLFFMSLIISIPLFLYMLRVGNNVVDKLVQYSLANEMQLSSLLYVTNNEELVDYLYNGISKVDVSRILIIAVTMFIMIAIICLVIFVQFMLRRNSIINQRRGE